MTAAAALRARGVSRSYGARVALEPTDLDVNAGEIVVLLGPNGAGKSTLLALLAEFELPPDGRPSAHLSVGNQQRLNLAIAFLGAPRVLLLDEPTASLDPPQARALWSRIVRARKGGAGAVVATHMLDEALQADRVLALRDGNVVFSGTPAEYLEGERH